MSSTLPLLLLLVPTVCQADDKDTKVSGKQEGAKLNFPAIRIAEGVKATIGLLESCHDSVVDPKQYTPADLKLAQGKDHIRMVFAKPVKVTVGNDKYEVSELVFTLPISRGVFWLHAGEKVVRCTKHTYQKSKPFEEWLRKAEGKN